MKNHSYGLIAKINGTIIEVIEVNNEVVGDTNVVFREYKCEVCKKEFARKENLMKHKTSSQHFVNRPEIPGMPYRPIDPPQMQAPRMQVCVSVASI